MILNGRESDGIIPAPCVLEKEKDDYTLIDSFKDKVIKLFKVNEGEFFENFV